MTLALCRAGLGATSCVCDTYSIALPTNDNPQTFRWWVHKNAIICVGVGAVWKSDRTGQVTGWYISDAMPMLIIIHTCMLCKLECDPPQRSSHSGWNPENGQCCSYKIVEKVKVLQIRNLNTGVEALLKSLACTVARSALSSDSDNWLGQAMPDKPDKLAMPPLRLGWNGITALRSFNCLTVQAVQGQSLAAAVVYKRDRLLTIGFHILFFPVTHLQTYSFIAMRHNHWFDDDSHEAQAYGRVIHIIACRFSVLRC